MSRLCQGGKALPSGLCAGEGRSSHRSQLSRGCRDPLLRLGAAQGRFPRRSQLSQGCRDPLARLHAGGGRFPHTSQLSQGCRAPLARLQARTGSWPLPCFEGGHRGSLLGTRRHPRMEVRRSPRQLCAQGSRRPRAWGQQEVGRWAQPEGKHPGRWLHPDTGRGPPGKSAQDRGACPAQGRHPAPPRHSVMGRHRCAQPPLCRQKGVGRAACTGKTSFCTAVKPERKKAIWCLLTQSIRHFLFLAGEFFSKMVAVCATICS